MSIRNSIAQFFEAEEVPFGLALMRICLPIGLLIAMTRRWVFAREIFSRDGANAPLWENFNAPGFLPEPGGTLAVALCSLLICTLITLSLGWMTRTSALICCLLTAYLGALDMTGTLTKYTAIAVHLLLLLSVSGAGKIWSVDAWVDDRKRQREGSSAFNHRPVAPVWPRRLTQILIAVVYFASAITKIRTPGYVSGDHMEFWLLTNSNFANPLGELLALYPPVIVMIGLLALCWEMLFCVLCWRSVGKAIVLIMGVVFHVMTALTLGLVIFPVICLAAYWTFLDERFYQSLAIRWRRLSRQLPDAYTTSFGKLLPSLCRPAWFNRRSSAVACCMLMAVCTVGGVEAERVIDPYGLRRPAGKPPLRELATAEVQRLFHREESIRPIDKLHNFSVGSLTVGERIVNSRSSFKQGELALIQAHIIPPHEDMWIEVNLHDADDRLINRIGQVLTRDNVRTRFRYQLHDAYKPGDYDFVLRFDGTEVVRHRFVLHPGEPQSPAVASQEPQPLAAAAGEE